MPKPVKSALLLLIITLGQVHAAFGPGGCIHRFEPVLHDQLELLNHLDTPQPRLVIAFSGVPGMGKTTLAKGLEEKLAGLRLSSATARQLLSEHHIDPQAIDSSGLRQIDQYMAYLQRRLDQLSPNHLLIIDASLDRTYKRLLSEAHAKGYQTLVVRLMAPRPVVEARIQGVKSGSEKHLSNLDDWYKQYEAFGDTGLYDIIIDTDAPYELSLQQILEAVEEVLHHSAI